jgi:hypothetical protein
MGKTPVSFTLKPKSVERFAQTEGGKTPSPGAYWDVATFAFKGGVQALNVAVRACASRRFNASTKVRFRAEKRGGGIVLRTNAEHLSYTQIEDIIMKFLAEVSELSSSQSVHGTEHRDGRQVIMAARPHRDLAGRQRRFSPRG